MQKTSFYLKSPAEKVGHLAWGVARGLCKSIRKQLSSFLL